MSSIIEGYSYDVFISYRQNDNQDGWVTGFVESLERELRSTLKDNLSVYFDENPHDGLQTHHEVDGSLKEKLKSLIILPVISQTYCDPNAFAWAQELVPFISMAAEDSIGLKTRVSNGNIASRILPVKIHEIGVEDNQLFEETTGGVLRSIDFIYKESGVNRPLLLNDDRSQNREKTDYRNQVNKVANAIKEIIEGLADQKTVVTEEAPVETKGKSPVKQVKARAKAPSFKVRRISRVEWMATALILALAALIYVSYALISERNTTPNIYHTSILPPDDLNFSTTNGANFELSPDGKYLAYVAIDSTGARSLWVKPLEEPKAYKIDDTETASFPFWSPDSRQIAFFADSELKKVSLNGGAVVSLGPANSGRGGSWSSNGTIIYCPRVSWAINKIPEGGGIPERITFQDTTNQERTHRWPYFLPDGEHFLYTVRYIETASRKEKIMLGSLDPGFEHKLIRNGASMAEYANGYIILAEDESLMAQKFDVESLEPVGDPIPILDGLYTEPATSRGAFTVSQTGQMIYQRRDNIRQGASHLVWYDRDGRRLDQLEEYSTVLIWHVRFSPDEKNVLVGKIILGESAWPDVWVYGVERSIWKKFSFQQAASRDPIWHPDGKKVFFTSNRQDSTVIIQKSADGSGSPLILHTELGGLESYDISSDGKYLLFSQRVGGIRVLPLTGENKVPFTFLDTSFEERRGTFSPDNKWVAYESDESGRQEVYIRPFEGKGKWQISSNGGSHPRWRKDGKELFYLSQGRTVVNAVRIEATENSISLGRKVMLFQFPSFGGVGADVYDVTGDGQKFLMASSVVNNAFTPLKLVVNWREKLEKR